MANNTDIVRLNEPVKRADSLRSLLDAFKPKIAEMCNRESNVKRVIQTAMMAVSRQPKLLECTGISILKAVQTSAELGLDCSGTMGHCYLVPYKNKYNQRMEAQFQMGYKGFIELALRSGFYSSIEAHAVFEDDVFEFELGLRPILRHVPNLAGTRDKAHVIGVYAIARYIDPKIEPRAEFMTVTDIIKIQEKSKAAKSGNSPWDTDWLEMARKTAIRRLAKFIRLTPYLARGVEIDDEEYQDTTTTATVDITAEAEVIEENQSRAKALATKLSPPAPQAATKRGPGRPPAKPQPPKPVHPDHEPEPEPEQEPEPEEGEGELAGYDGDETFDGDNDPPVEDDPDGPDGAPLSDDDVKEIIYKESPGFIEKSWKAGVDLVVANHDVPLEELCRAMRCARGTAEQVRAKIVERIAELKQQEQEQ